MISVTDLTSYLYCPRKLYYRKVLGLKDKPSKATLIGTVKHIVFERSGKEDRVIIGNFTSLVSLEDLEMQYRKVYYSVLKQAIKEQKEKIERLGLKELAIYQEVWPFFLEEAKEKSKQLFELAKEKNAYGDDLWLALPKGVPELRIASEALDMVGIVDQVNIDEGFAPVELKTGKAPREGVWKSHKIQVGAYMLLLSEHYGEDVNKGYVNYLSVGEERPVIMNAFLRDEIMDLLQRVKILLQQHETPERVKEMQKCDHCGLRDACYAEN